MSSEVVTESAAKGSNLAKQIPEPENETARAIYEAAEVIAEAAREPGTVKKPLPLAT